MRRTCAVAVIVALAAAAPAAGAADDAGRRGSGTPARGPRVPWRTGLPWAEAIAAAQRAGAPILIDFTAVWCGPCRLLDVMVFNEPAVIDALADVVTLQVDFDAPGVDDLPGRFGVSSLPTLVWCDPDGREIDRLNGYVASSRFLGIVADWRRGVGVEAGLARALAAHPQSPELLFEAAQRHERAGRLREAAVALRRLLNLAVADSSLAADARRSLAELMENEHP